jgi:hypothetical protein
MADIDLDAISAEAAKVERLLVLETEEDGLPPSIDRVVADYRQVIRLMNWLDNAAALLRYEAFAASEDDFLGRFKQRVLAAEKPTDKSLSDLVADFSVVRPAQPNDPNVAIKEPPRAVARILGATHENPLETLILVTAGSLTLLLLGAAFSYRKIKTTQATTAQQQTITQALDKLADTVIENIKHGQKTNVDSAIKFAKVLIEATPKAFSEKLKLQVSLGKVAFETAATTPGSRSERAK